MLHCNDHITGPGPCSPLATAAAQSAARTPPAHDLPPPQSRCRAATRRAPAGCAPPEEAWLHNGTDSLHLAHLVGPQRCFRQSIAADCMAQLQRILKSEVAALSCNVQCVDASPTPYYLQLLLHAPLGGEGCAASPSSVTRPRPHDRAPCNAAGSRPHSGCSVTWSGSVRSITSLKALQKSPNTLMHRCGQCDRQLRV